MRIDLYKAERDPDRPNTAKIAGIISTDEVDLQGERVLQKGLDFSYFLKKGTFNYEHKPGAENMLGYPTKITQRKGYTEVEGVLLLDKPRARDIYETAAALNKAGGHRTLGFSVEGQVLARDEMDPKIVKKARVINCAITSNPINPDTTLNLIKSVSALLLRKGAGSLSMPRPSSAGYQTPSQVNGQSIQGLVPQQLDQTVSATYNTLNDERLSAIIKRLSKLYPNVSQGALARAAAELSGVLI
jgi:hypothetical protein